MDMCYAICTPTEITLDSRHPRLSLLVEYVLNHILLSYIDSKILDWISFRGPSIDLFIESLRQDGRFG